MIPEVFFCSTYLEWNSLCFSPKLFDINNFQDAQVKVWVNKYGAEINLSAMCSPGIIIHKTVKGSHQGHSCFKMTLSYVSHY